VKPVGASARWKSNRKLESWQETPWARRIRPWATVRMGEYILPGC